MPLVVVWLSDTDAGWLIKKGGAMLENTRLDYFETLAI